MKAITRIILLVFALYLAGCATTQSGAGTSGSATVTSESGNGKMLTQKDYERIGIKETGR